MSLTDKHTSDSDLKHNHADASHTEVGRKKKRHCARFWWIYLIISLLIALLVILLVIFVAFPRIAQHDVDDSSLEFTELQFLDPTPESLAISQQSILRNPSKFTPTLDHFNASILLVTNGTIAKTGYMTLLLPEIHAKKPQSDVVIESQKATIDDAEQLAEFATQVLKNDNVTMRLEGRTKLHLGKLPATNVNYKESVTFKGLNGLKGFNVLNTLVNISAKAGDPNMQAIALIPNPSVMTIAMGNVTLSVTTEKGTPVGETQILNMLLKPGDNNLPMTGTINTTALLTESDAKTGIVNLHITGKSALYNGEHLEYYEKALASNELILPMNVIQVVADSQKARAEAAAKATASATPAGR